MITIKNITTDDPLYALMRELRNKILLRPLGIPDNSWEMYDDISWHFVAVENKKVVGCAVLVPAEEKPNKARLIQMAVDTAVQGKGIGKLLIYKIIAFAKNQDIKEITCHSRAYAVNFYKKLGFEVYGEPFEEVGIPHNHMKLKV
ncbi:GNAT family N-acetyltransferase [Sinomicrobium weinanense]|uniref:GNAT family N-acetyltransferase n=1 Tax=Sinomicrobium weinanense TaxID=2842200 RepID=A0A926Q344_9FLAO|nr:GNAT family N-acetyltransferase [Sinomicrobium weinanense]MBC9797257.1 GNAT family N-acetyltransferase [Sinomicrobium weinanense]MBU3122341.1 GNAT family N-acetyltransferase [Sinomicrobium weinanense]